MKVILIGIGSTESGSMGIGSIRKSVWVGVDQGWVGDWRWIGGNGCNGIGSVGNQAAWFY